MTEAYARATDPDTSHSAAETVDANRLEAIVLEAIRKFPNGCIADDIEAATGLRWGAFTPRIKPLIEKGHVVDTGQRRRAKSGKSQRVLFAIKQGEGE